MPSEDPAYRAIEKYKKKTYDRIELLVYKGEKELIKDFASKRGLSVNGFITGLIRREINEDIPSDTESEDKTNKIQQ